MAREVRVRRVGEELDGPGDVLRFAQPAGRRAPHDLRELILVQAVAHLGAEVTGGHPVDGDPARTELAGHRPGEAVERRLGRAVHGQPAVTRKPDDGRDVDDAPAAAGEHPAAHLPGHVNRALEVEVDDRVDVVVGDDPEDAVAGHAGVVHQDVHPPPLLDHGGHERLRVRRSGEVGRREQEPVGRLRILGPRVRLVGGRARAGGDEVAAVEERLHQPGAEAAAAAGHHDDPRLRGHGTLLTILFPARLTESTNLMLRGRAAAGRSAQAARMSASITAWSAAGAATTSTATIAPVIGLGRPYTRAMSTPGTAATRSSIGSGCTLTPPTLMTSDVRPRKTMRSPTTSTRSPVGRQASGSTGSSP